MEPGMIIDCHGHYTTAPPQHDSGRKAQLAAFREGSPAPAYPAISDDEIREPIEQNQRRLLRERGAGTTFFSPLAPSVAHHTVAERVGGERPRACHSRSAR